MDGDLQLYGNEIGKNVPQKLELSALNFYPILTVMTFANSFHRILNEESQAKISPVTSRQSHIPWDLNIL